MGRVLLWTETLTACLLVVALAAAWSARLSRRWLRVGVPTLTALVPGLVGLWAAVLGGWLVMKAQAQMYDWVFWYAAAWVVVFAVGALLIVRGALRRGAGVGWSRGRLLLAMVVAAVLSVTTLWSMDQAARSKLAVARADAGVLALSLTPSRPPDSRNAALVYEQAFGLIGKDTEVPTFSPEGDNAEARAFIKRYEVALMLLRQAGAMPDCYFPRPLSPADVDALMPVLGQMRQGAKLLLLDARVQAADGHAAPALHDVEATFALARHAGENPVLIQTLVAIAIGAIADSAVQDVLKDCQPSFADLQEAPVDQTFSYWRLLQRSMSMERAIRLGYTVEMSERTGGAIFLANEVYGHRSLMQEYDKVLSKPYYQAKEGLERLEKQAQSGRWGVLQVTLSPALARAAISAAWAQASWELDNMALAATAYRIEHGAFPKEAADLVPQYLTLVPLDPFSGKPMKIRAVDGGIVLYSIGPDMVDDGGAPLDPTSQNGDLTFRLWAPGERQGAGAAH